MNNLCLFSWCRGSVRRGHPEELYGILRCDLGDLEAIAEDLRRVAATRGQ